MELYGLIVAIIILFSILITFVAFLCCSKGPRVFTTKSPDEYIDLEDEEMKKWADEWKETDMKWERK